VLSTKVKIRKRTKLGEGGRSENTTPGESPKMVRFGLVLALRRTLAAQRPIGYVQSILRHAILLMPSPLAHCSPMMQPCAQHKISKRYCSEGFL
jgi:hypothetical protein